ncbi:unnamed protein product [Cyclocybe aegerita]|uniref:Nephrocystin 3-like N-terminal domain-containing protein n=1 Tax=Cyclocybe aegerita TaxID=1973307 RepID=A0A8S0VVY2_CYCAE|nr:unnamed protein product [Cyclocybe aegerita]
MCLIRFYLLSPRSVSALNIQRWVLILTTVRLIPAILAPQTDVRFFEGAHNVFIANSAFHVETSQPTRFSGWKDVISPSAFHNSGERYEPPRCHPGTREALLGRIMSWVRGDIDTEALIFWLNGYVGVGKSAIAQTIAEICEREGLLLASFFFGRSDPARNDAKFLVTTLAYQIGLAVSPARHRIEQALNMIPLSTPVLWKHRS